MFLIGLPESILLKWLYHPRQPKDSMQPLSKASLLIQMVKNLPAHAKDPGLIPGSGRSPGEENGYPLQYSCLENSMDRRAWQAIVYGVAKGQTRLNTHSQIPPNLITNGIFHTTGTKKKIKFVWTYKRPWNTKAIMKKDRAGKIRLPDFKIYCKATIISMVLAQKQLYRSMEQDRMSKNKHTHLWSIHLW